MTPCPAVSRSSVAALTLLLAAGCASVPPAPEPTLSVAEARASEAEPAPDVAVRWGGTIADVRNTADGTTVLEVVSRPLRAGGRPRGGDATDGRFLAEVDAFLDPEIVKAGRDVTVTGRLAGRREGRIGEMAYRYPVVAVDDYRYWRPEPPPAHFPHPAPISGYGHHHGFLHDWPHPFPHHHHRRGRGAMVSGSVSF